MADDLDQGMPAKTYNILSIDGGPAGLLQIHLLRKLERAVPGFLAATDIFAGTSNGSIVGLFLASRLPADADEAVRLSPAILDDAIAFSDATVQAMHPSLSNVLSFFTGLRPISLMEPLSKVLEAAFGDMKLCDMARMVIVASMNMNTFQPRTFRWLHGRAHDDGHMKIADVIMASSSLPLFFSLFGDEAGDHFLDGAFVANNPSMLAVTFVLGAMAGRSRIHVNTAGRSELEMSRVLSLGVNDTLQGMHASLYGCHLLGPTLSKVLLGSPDQPGMLKWGFTQLVLSRPTLLADLLYQGQNGEVARQCEALLGARRHFRYAPFSPAFAELAQLTFGRPGRLLDAMAREADKIWSDTAITSRLIDFVKREWIRLDHALLPDMAPGHTEA